MSPVGKAVANELGPLGVSSRRDWYDERWLIKADPKLGNETRPRKTEPRAPDGAGDGFRTHDFNLGNILLAQNTIREIQQHQPHRVPWRCVPSRGVLRKVEGWVEDLGWLSSRLSRAAGRRRTFASAPACRLRRLSRRFGCAAYACPIRPAPRSRYDVQPPGAQGVSLTRRWRR